MNYLKEIFRKREKYFWWLLEFSGCFLFILFLAYFITGYGMTKGLFDKATATLWHQRYLPVPAIIFFVIHSALGARILLRRWKLGQDKLIMFFTLGIFLVILVMLLYLNFR